VTGLRPTEYTSAIQPIENLRYRLAASNFSKEHNEKQNA
jgi:hypothetical protein